MDAREMRPGRLYVWGRRPPTSPPRPKAVFRFVNLDTLRADGHVRAYYTYLSEPHMVYNTKITKSRANVREATPLEIADATLGS